MGLLCHCDHCQNNTCVTNEHGLCWAEIKLDPNNEIVKTANCFNQESKLVQNLICDHTTTKTSQSIRRCCNTADYCNQRDDFLPPDDEAKRLLLQQLGSSSQFSHYKPTLDSRPRSLLNPSPANISSSSPTKISYISSPISSNRTFISRKFEQYSNIPVELRLGFILLSGLLLIFGMALATRYFRLRRRKRAFNTSHQQHQKHNNPATRHHNSHDGDEYSENSSFVVNSDMAAADTNSLESREPLINVKSCNNPQINLIHNPNWLGHPNATRGPFMAGDSLNGKIQSSFQMSMGSGDRSCRLRELSMGSSSTTAGIQAIGLETSSGSGAGQPYLTQRSISHDIELIEVVGRGYFGVVWRGQYKGEPVAVKIFSSLAEANWRREAEIYQTPMLRHRNILGFIATDKKEDLSMTGYWLVTDYYPLGSLFNFLMERSMSMPDALRMAFSIANGLAHLHVEIFGTQGKPAIAHRDIKSKNILVKNDGTCCLADLGMAARYNSNSGVVDVPSNVRVGTRRYLAPEILDNKLNLMDFEAVKAADIYALGLVLWEVLRRTCYAQTSKGGAGTVTKILETSNMDDLVTKAGSLEPCDPCLSADELSKPLIKESESSNYHFMSASSSIDIASILMESVELSIDDLDNELARVCDSFRVPYQGLVSLEPTMEEMQDVVCERKIRPPISPRWTKFAPMRDYATLMRECWYVKPQARLSALRVRKTLGDIARHYFNINMEFD